MYFSENLLTTAITLLCAISGVVASYTCPSQTTLDKDGKPNCSPGTYFCGGQADKCGTFTYYCCPKSDCCNKDDC